MSSGASGSDENISAAKIQPLDATIKSNHPHDQSPRDAAGADRAIEQARIDPLGGQGQYQHSAPHADSQGVVGRDYVLQGSKIDPLGGFHDNGAGKDQGLDDENVDAARVAPLGAVREQIG